MKQYQKEANSLAEKLRTDKFFKKQNRRVRHKFYGRTPLERGESVPAYRPPQSELLNDDDNVQHLRDILHG